MVYCLQAELAFSTATRRNNVLSGIQTRITGRPRWDVDVVEAFDGRPRLGQNAVRVELRFVSRADQEDLEDRMDALFPANPPLAGSWLRLHDCGHDEGAGACTPASTRTW